MSSKTKVGRASAPAKVILFGEHAVVYGRSALATAIDMRVSVEIRKGSGEGYHLRIAAPSIQPFSVHLHKLKEDKEESMALDYVKECITYFEENYLEKKEAIDIDIRSEVPISAGLGSSSAVCVSLLSALLDYFDCDFSLEDISKGAHKVEKRVQINASPTDTAVSTFGHFIRIEKDRMRMIPGRELELIVGCIPTRKFERTLKTKLLVEHVRRKKDDFPRVFENIFDAIDEITTCGCEALLSGNLPRFGHLMNINHYLLEACDVVPFQLSKMVKTCQLKGAIGAKITGAGGKEGIIEAGSIIVLPPQDPDVKAQIKREIADAGGIPIETVADGRGLMVRGRNFGNS